jgi:preprotein translocase subunit SecF
MSRSFNKFNKLFIDRLIFMDFPNIYSYKNYKYFILVPIVLLVISLLFIFFLKPIKFGIDFKGGIEAQIISSEQPDINKIQQTLEKEGFDVFFISSDKNPSGFLTFLELSRSKKVSKAEQLKSEFFLISKNLTYLEVELISLENSKQKNASLEEKYQNERNKLNSIANELFELANKEKNASLYENLNILGSQVQGAFASITNSEYSKLRDILSSFAPNSLISIKERTSTLSEDFISRAINTSLISILLISLAVFLIFRTLIPSLAVLAGAFADIIFALGLMSIFSIPLNLPTFATLLMLIGFSLDTDILLTMNILKRSDLSLRERAHSAMSTGVTMSLSTMVAFITLFVVGYITKIQLYTIIAIVAIGGLIGDLIATWAFNAVILLTYVEKLEREGKKIEGRSIFEILFRN